MNNKDLSKPRYKRLKNNLREGTLLKTEFGSFLIKEIILAPKQNQRFKTYFVEFFYVEENRTDKVDIQFANGIVGTSGYGFVEDFIL